MIDGLQLIPRLRHSNDRGYVTEILRSDYFYVVAGTMKVGLHDDPDEERVAWDAFDDIWTGKSR